ncbi:hypothetical protein MA16_Dca003795 [Dendrobium catenatum]|uniref:Uncharacterized protein n=1 Tax=Dendrobium catenatum TaxID=906689 RepID=A0A2I0WG35_9ASPA|nr:hypothetical protein MA16_Dca003795 [Dendrobium catenatum]
MPCSVTASNRLQVVARCPALFDRAGSSSSSRSSGSSHLTGSFAFAPDCPLSPPLAMAAPLQVADHSGRTPSVSSDEGSTLSESSVQSMRAPSPPSGFIPSASSAGGGIGVAPLPPPHWLATESPLPSPLAVPLRPAVWPPTGPSPPTTVPFVPGPPRPRPRTRGSVPQREVLQLGPITTSSRKRKKDSLASLGGDDLPFGSG